MPQTEQLIFFIAFYINYWLFHMELTMLSMLTTHIKKSAGIV